VPAEEHVPLTDLELAILRAAWRGDGSLYQSQADAAFWYNEHNRREV
jgi:hypothetical protein